MGGVRIDFFITYGGRGKGERKNVELRPGGWVCKVVAWCHRHTCGGAFVVEVQFGFSEQHR